MSKGRELCVLNAQREYKNNQLLTDSLCNGNGPNDVGS